MLHGDCLDLLPSIPAGSVDLVCADLPYGVTANKWDSVIPFEPLWAELLRVGKRNAAFVFTATQPFATALINSQPKLFRYDLVWEKPNATGFFNARFAPLRAHETVVVFYRAKPTYHPQMSAGKPYKGMFAPKEQMSVNYRDMSGAKAYTRRENPTGERFPRSVFFIAAKETKLHPTQKPVALLEWLVKTYTNPGDTVLDPTAGSFTTGVACINTGRSFIGIERDAGYFDLGLRRCHAALDRSAATLLAEAERLQCSITKAC